MSLIHNANVVRDGLVLYLDAANPKSYPGSGTTWYDLSGNGYSSVLTNSPTYTSDNKGSIVFDGTNDYITLTWNKALTFSTGASFEVIIYPYSFLSHIAVFNAVNATHTMLYIGQNVELSGKYFRPHISLSTGYYYGSINAPVTENNWYHVVYTYDSTSGSFLSYINNILYPMVWSTASPPSGATVSYFPTSSTMYIGYDNRGTLNYSGKFSNFKIYNRALSSAEIAQNFAAHRGRYNI